MTLGDTITDDLIRLILNLDPTRIQIQTYPAVQVMFISSWWHIWEERNNMVFKGTFSSLESVARFVQGMTTLLFGYGDVLHLLLVSCI
ncbi:hypothetical protein EJ110_NYTH05829 [Nymphaea thermarum]|nr:hypothetical protein EJ110_NYTH05829 [Nymphaea thermarum]